jgi:hypothetical protein
MSFLEIKCTNKWCSKSGRCWRFNAPDNGKNQLYDFYEPYIVTDKHDTTQCAWYETPTSAAAKKRGGPHPGSGRPPKDPADKVVKCNISMTAAHHAATAGDRAGMIRRALDVYFGIRGMVDGCKSCINNKPGSDARLSLH